MDMFKLSFPVPPIFYSHSDEDRFFQGFYALPEYVRITGVLRELTLELRQPPGRESILELIALLARYRIELAYLRPAMAALSDEDRAWFQRPAMFWHDGLFGDAQASDRPR